MTVQEQQHFSQRVRRYFYIFYILVCGTLLNACASYVPFGNHSINIAVALAIALGEACLAAGFFMHLLSERKLIYSLLAFTACFFVGLMFLTVSAFADVPHLSIPTH